jgi:hypothetical protein
MNFWYIPTENALLNVFLRSLVLFVILVFGFKNTYYNAYWVLVVHDAISLTFMPH